MRLGIVGVMILALSACASSSRDAAKGSQCEPEVFSGELTSGLVTLPPYVETQLLSLLPANVGSIHYCWYQMPSGHLEAKYIGYGRAYGSEGAETKAGGYEFERRENDWYFLRKNEYAVLEY